MTVGRGIEVNVNRAPHSDRDAAHRFFAARRFDAALLGRDLGASAS